jgi:hypothetical protein
MTKTIFASGNFEGDGTRLDVVLEQTRGASDAAAKRGNVIALVFLGNVAPDVHLPSADGKGEDSMQKIVGMARLGAQLSPETFVPPSEVVLLAGQRELAWLRLVNTDPATREITRGEDPNAAAVLARPAPACAGRACGDYNDSVAIMPQSSKPHVVSILMFLKLVALASHTMKAPGLVHGFAASLRRCGGDAASNESLRQFLANFSGSIQDGVDALLHGDELTPEGLGVLPAVRDLLASVLGYAETTAATYLRKSALVRCVKSGVAPTASKGLWLFASGVSGERLAELAPDHTPGSEAWEDAVNSGFSAFVRKFTTGVVDATMYSKYLSLGEGSCRGAPLECLSALGPVRTASGVVSQEATPFATLGRRKIADGEGPAGVVGLAAKWASVNTEAFTPSTFWAVASWCRGTQRDLLGAPAKTDRAQKLGEQLYEVGVTFASLLVTKLPEGGTLGTRGMDALDGLVGPVVGGEAGRAMRVLSFTSASFGTAFVVLLPDGFVKAALASEDVDLSRVSSGGGPVLFTSGFLALPDASEVPLVLPGLSSAELEGLRRKLGARVWALPPKRLGTKMATFAPEDHGAIAEMRTGQPLGEGFRVLRCDQCESDPLAGLRVGLRKLPGISRVTIYATRKQDTVQI